MNPCFPTLLTTLTLEQACHTDIGFSSTLAGILKAHGHPQFTVPVVGQCRRSDFPALFPHEPFKDGPVALIGLPQWMGEKEGQSFAANLLFPCNALTRDLRARRTCLRAASWASEILIDAELMQRTINDIGDDGLHVIWVWGDKLLITTYRLDELSVDIGYFMMSAGVNYHPVWTDTQFAEAAQTMGLDPREADPPNVWWAEVY